MQHSTFTVRRALKWALLIAVVFVILAYSVFQARYLITGPQIVLSSPSTTLHNERQITLGGSAYNISRMWLNDRQIYTDAQGDFKEALILENGYTVVTLRAEDRYGRVTEVTRPFVYKPASFE